MSLQKGKDWPRVQPWTATNNWRFDSKPSRHVKTYWQIVYANFPLNGGPTISQKYTFDYKTLQFQWVTPDFGIPFTTFGLRSIIKFIPGTDYNLEDIEMTDFQGGLLTARFDIPPDTVAWDDQLREFNQFRVSLKVSGSFQDLIDYGHSNVRYADEP